MFERFTDRARRVVVLAQNAARDMGHAQIKPEHLLVALWEGEGLATDAMAQAGVDGAALRERVAALYASTPAAKEVDKVPFDTESKKCLEQSLRAALALGHNYIGTEHLFFGVERHAGPGEGSLDDLLGVPTDEIHRRLTDTLGSLSSGAPMRSPALKAALDRARSRANKTPMTTGHALAGMLADPDSQVSRAFSEIGVDRQRIEAALDSVNLAETSDAGPSPKSVAVTAGDTTTVIADPELAAALGQLGTEQLRAILKDAIDRLDAGEPPE
jgi:ATP-dependent Clp protease ATP-binding subunit ClpA